MVRPQFVETHVMNNGMLTHISVRTMLLTFLYCMTLCTGNEGNDDKLKNNAAWC